MIRAITASVAGVILAALALACLTPAALTAGVTFTFLASVAASVGAWVGATAAVTVPALAALALVSLWVACEYLASRAT